MLKSQRNGPTRMMAIGSLLLFLTLLVKVLLDVDLGRLLRLLTLNSRCVSALSRVWRSSEVETVTSSTQGKWFAPLIDNPEYKGVWAPKKIP